MISKGWRKGGEGTSFRIRSNLQKSLGLQLTESWHSQAEPFVLAVSLRPLPPSHEGPQDRSRRSWLFLPLNMHSCFLCSRSRVQSSLVMSQLVAMVTRLL